jgi:hypothetical protein
MKKLLIETILLSLRSKCDQTYFTSTSATVLSFSQAVFKTGWTDPKIRNRLNTSFLPRKKARLESFSTVPRASNPVFIFSAPGLVFGDAESVDSRFHILRALTRFRRYRGRRLLFSCFARPNSFPTVPTSLGPVFMFCAPGHVFGGAKGAGSFFHVMRSRTRFGGPKCVWSYFHVLRA